MASESINILIEADNQASAVFKTVAKDVDGMSKKVKEVGGQTKASAEIAGTLANALGGSAFGSFAGQMAQITERVSAFSEVSKAGAAGALAFKAGLLAAVGVVTYKVAETIASWWFEIDKAKEKAAQAEKAFASMSAAFEKMRAKQFAQTKEDLSLIRDPGEREKATNDAAAKLEKQSKELDSKIAKAQAEVAKRQEQFSNQWSTDDTDLQNARDQLSTLTDIKQRLDDESQSLRDLTSQRAKSIEQRKADNAAADKSDAYLKSLREEIELTQVLNNEQAAKISGDPAAKEQAEAARRALEASRNVTPDKQGLASALMEVRDELKAKAEEQRKAEQAAEAATRKEQDGIQRIAELEKKRMVDLEARRIELEKGRQAAAAYRLEQDGLSKATAERLAAEEEQIKMADEAKGKGKSLEADSSPQQAVQARLLTKGTGGDIAAQSLNVLKAILGVGQAQVRSNEEISTALRNKDPYSLKTVVVP